MANKSIFAVQVKLHPVTTGNEVVSLRIQLFNEKTMRFYKNRQAEMLHWVATVLKEEQLMLSTKVPALKDFIAEFTEKEEALYFLRNGNPDAVKGDTLQKKSVKEAFVEVIMKLLSVVKAANYKSKNSQAGKVHFTESGLNKLTAEKLCEAYHQAFAAVKKIKNPGYFGLSETDILDAKAYYKEFASKKNAPTQRKKEVASKNSELHAGIKECITMLENSIDPLMRIAAEGNRELNMKYKAARKVMAKAQGRPSDAEASYRKSRERKKSTDETAGARAETTIIDA